MATKELTPQEHNAKIEKELTALEEKKKELMASYKPEANTKQATLAECNAITNKKHKK